MAMPTAPTSSPEFLDLLKKSGLLAPDRVAALSDLGLPDDPQKAANKLIAQGLLTRFQATQLLAGRHKGFRIGGYVIKDMLGRGGMGAVYLAEHLELHRKVAIKILVPGRDEDQVLALERFIREARSAAALDHPNIVRIFDVARHNDVPYLVMEYVDGETLQQVLDRDGAVPYPIATEYVAQAAAGLQHAHEKGFIHRDIKPGNLMRDKSGLIKILDMGLARSSTGGDNLTERLDNGAVVGTADFIAPEQALNQPNIDGRADIYSLGASFFALIIGKPPFEGNTTQKLLQHQLRSAPKLAALDATLPKGLSAVVAKMLAKKPEDRYQTPAEVIAALAPWMGNSSRILAGISKTNLAQGADLQATLAEVARGTTKRLHTKTVPDVDEDEVDVESGRDTGGVSSSKTTRERPRRKKVAAGPDKKKLYIYGAVAVGVSILGVLGAWALSGPSKKQSAENSAPPDPGQQQVANTIAPAAKTSSRANSKANTTPTKVNPGREAVVYKFDPSEIAPFRMRLNGAAVVDGKKGVLPRGIMTYALKEGEAEYEVGMVDNTPVFAITRRSKVGDTHVAFELERETAVQGIGLRLKEHTEYKIRIRYRATDSTPITVSVHTIVGYKPAGYNNFPTAKNAWETKELTVTRRDEPLRLTVATLGTGVQVAIASLETVEVVPADKK
jgi:eukaryotic-like serine/threonine-protein kinase